MNRFYAHGIHDALENIHHKTCRFSAKDCPGCWGDVPAILTATYSEAPTQAEMQWYGQGYFDTLEKHGVGSIVALETEKRRLANFIAAGGRSSCEQRWFGYMNPSSDRDGGSRYRYTDA